MVVVEPGEDENLGKRFDGLGRKKSETQRVIKRNTVKA